MIVRAVTAADAAALAEIHATAFDTPWDEATFTALLATPAVLALAADTPPVGVILCRIAADEAEILTLATRPARRRAGVAMALLEAAVETVTAHGATSLFLEVATDNLAARDLYTKALFMPVGRRSGYYAHPDGAVDAVILRRDLNR